jgi:hypothetical protein
MMWRLLSKAFNAGMILLFLWAAGLLIISTYGAVLAIAPAWFTFLAPIVYPLCLIIACIGYRQRRDKPPYLGFHFGLAVLMTLLTPIMVGMVILYENGGLLGRWINPTLTIVNPLSGVLLHTVFALLLVGATMPIVTAFLSGRRWAC